MEYLSWGITESLIHLLGRLEQLHVAPASSVHRYQKQTPDPRTLGRELNVGAVVTGRVTARGDTLVVGTELVDAHTGWQIWGRQYSRKASDLASIHEEIAREISDGLRLMTRDEKKILEQPTTQDPTAYQLYLQGRFSFGSKDESGLKRALRFFTTAVRRDPGFALAQVGVADANAWLAFFSVLPPHECFPKAREAVNKACEMDPALAEAHAAQGLVAFEYEWDMARAEKEFRRAIELNPKYVSAHYWFGWYLAAMGRPEEAEAELAEVRKLEPGSLLARTYEAFACYLSRRHESAMELLESVLGKASHFAVAHWWLGLACMEKGDYERALEAFEEAVRRSEGHPSPLASLGHLYGRLGWAGDSRRVEEQLEGLSGKRYVSAFDRAVCLAANCDRAPALAWLEKAREEHSVLLAYINVWPAMDPLRPEAKFQTLARSIGFPLPASARRTVASGE
jgi:TolB-like protein/tetratricopeptide (TPR) repeat protein